MKILFSLLVVISVVAKGHALIISEIMYDPDGSNTSRRWIEIYNDTSSPINITSAWKFFEDGTRHGITSYQGGTSLSAGSYAIIADNAQTFQTEYSYSGILFDSAFTHPVTNNNGDHIAMKESSSGPEISPVDYNPSLGGNNDGSTLSKIGGVWVRGKATPGAVNMVSTSSDSGNNATSTNSQITIAKQSAPSPDIILYMPFEKTVVAGADATFSTYGMTRGGVEIDRLVCNWAFGDGGQGAGTSTVYRYVYPGRYIAKVEASNGSVAGEGIMRVLVVPPDIYITKVESGKYGTYVDISNPNNYELDLSQWKLSFDGKGFPFPKNTLIAGGATTRFSGLAMGFASTTITQNSVVKILFPNLEDVVSYYPNLNQGTVAGTSTSVSIQAEVKKIIPRQVINIPRATTTPLKNVSATSSSVKNVSGKVKDTRIIAWFKSIFGK